MRKVINKLNEMNFNRKSDKDQFGAIYEQLLKTLEKESILENFTLRERLPSF